ncbi:hypothetical protein BB558_004129 [Smittium angustum]|uniref:Uncharacterized protein n=1 Tax=Smittium angustum TaxID=133377 RepID=A0A2U1J425_SMIAN|nr:hypothetical protein BB558_004129 [Smittium angustum]
MDKITSYEIFSKIFIFSQNPDVRLVSHGFYEISTLNTIRARFLIKKTWKKEDQGAYLDSKSIDDLFYYSLGEYWNKVVIHLLSDFTETTKKEFQNQVQRRKDETRFETPILEPEKTKYYVPRIDINSTRCFFHFARVCHNRVAVQHTFSARKLTS